MHLRFVDRRISTASAADELTRETYATMNSFPDGMPILLDDHWRPVEPWLTYFRVLGSTAGKSTMRNYGYDAYRFASYLDTRGTDVVHASAEDIQAYREWRLREISRPVSPATWQREGVVIRGIYQPAEADGRPAA